MKKLLLVFAALALVLTLSACGEKEDEVVCNEETLAAGSFTVGLVTDTGGIDDKSFNQGTWEGVERFACEYGVLDEDIRYVQSASDADYLPNISAFADEDLDLIVMPGFLFEASLITSAANYPDQKFLIIDMVVMADNVASAVFAANEGSFLAGVAAALKAEEAGKDTVGFIGGGDFGLIQNFEAGFEAGVWAVDSTMTVLVDYVGDFQSANIGQTLAAKQYDAGAYVIYHAAGGAGNGLIKEAKDRRTNGEDVWAIGVDKDQYADGIYNDADDSAILTSMMKRVDVAAYNVALAVLNGTFPGGNVLTFNLANNGVGLPAENPNLSEDMLATIATYRTGIIDGTYDVPLVPVRISAE